MNEYTYYATFGSGQPGYPGYLIAVVKAASEADAWALARQRVREATDNKYCGFYGSLEEVHVLDRIYRGNA